MMLFCLNDEAACAPGNEIFCAGVSDGACTSSLPKLRVSDAASTRYSDLALSIVSFYRECEKEKENTMNE
jgi:hypothetical protein